jgi:cyclase
MKQLTKNVFVETELRGSNHGLVTTSDGIVLIDTPHKPSDAIRLSADVERRGRLRYILNTEPHTGPETHTSTRPSSPTRACARAS